MAEPESINTMAQNSFKKLADGSYAIQTSTPAIGGGVQTVGLDSTANTVKLDQTDPNNRVATVPNAAANSTSITDTNTVTSPAAGAAIATTPQLSVGTWDIEVITFIGGTTVASLEATNMRLTVGAAAIGRVLNPVPGTSGGVAAGNLRVRYVVNSAAPASVVAVSAATAGAVYSASIVAKKVV